MRKTVVTNWTIVDVDIPAGLRTLVCWLSVAITCICGRNLIWPERLNVIVVVLFGASTSSTLSTSSFINNTFNLTNFA